jgi:glucans biosynthesis protein C
LFAYWKDRPSRFISNLISKTNGLAIYLPLIWFILVEAFLRVKWPGNLTLINDWANFFYYLALYLLGFLYSQHQSFAKAVTEKFPVSLALAISTTSIISYIAITKVNIIWSYNPKTLLYLMLHGINTWFWLLVLIGLGSKWFNFSNRFLKYANDACFPYYILHYLPVTIIGYYIVNRHLPVGIKFGIVTLASILITLVLYEILFKRVNIIRILFGIQPLAKEKS